jgi:hypothetical protein
VAELFVAIALAPAAESQQLVAGWIVRITPPAKLYSATNLTQAVPLSPKDRFRWVYVDDRIECDANGLVELVLLWKGTERITNGISFTLPPPVRPTNAPSIVDALHKFKHAGRTRAGNDDSLIQFPPAMLEAISNQWKRARQNVGVELRNADGQLIARSRVSLMTPEDEKELEAGLMWWDQQSSGIVRSVGRAAIYSTRNLHHAAAVELDRALALPDAADSVHLLREAIMEADLAGKVTDRESLMERLRELEE